MFASQNLTDFGGRATNLCGQGKDRLETVASLKAANPIPPLTLYWLKFCLLWKKSHKSVQGGVNKVMNRLFANILIAIAIIILIRSVVDFRNNGTVSTVNPVTTTPAEPGTTTPSPGRNTTERLDDEGAANRSTTGSSSSRSTARDADRSVPALW